MEQENKESTTEWNNRIARKTKGIGQITLNLRNRGHLS